MLHKTGALFVCGIYKPTFSYVEEALDLYKEVIKKAKQVNSNSKYLSRIIKLHKAESFFGYIQNLRIDQVLNRLKNDTKFRELTIDTIAIESGYNQRESFSKSFEKVTGMRPSYFIKELKKKNTKSILT